MLKPKAAFLCSDHAKVLSVYGKGRLERIAELTDLLPGIVTDVGQRDLSDVELVFSTWGMLALTEEQLARHLPKLKVVFYAAGATEGFVRPFLHRGIACSSAWQANAIPVAEFAFAQILLGLKGAQRLCRRLHSPAQFNQDFAGPGVYGATVGLLGDGAVAHHLEKMLGICHLSVQMLPTFPEKRSMSLEQFFASSQVVSNHLPNREDNIGVVTQSLLESMPRNGVFINTGRGRQIDEPGMIAALKNRPDLTAILDVTYPEPPLPDSDLYSLPNVFLTPHLAGSNHDECHRMADYMLEELERHLAGQPLKYPVLEEYLIPAP